MKHILTQQQGFTLIELLVIMSIIAILSSVFVPRFLDLDKKRANLVISEMWTIAEAIQTYDTQNGTFPDAAGNCINAITTLTASNLLAGIDANDNAWDGGSYITSCIDNAASISILMNTEWASYTKNALPNSTTDGTRVVLHVSKLAYVPVLERFLYLDATPSGNYIVSDANDIILAGRNTTDDATASLARAVFYQDVVVHNSGVIVTMPTCTFGSPKLITAPVSLRASNDEIIRDWLVNTATTTPTWSVSITLRTATLTSNTTPTLSFNEGVTPTATSILFISTKCQ